MSVRVRTVGDGPISADGGVVPGQVAEIIVALDGEPVVVEGRLAS